MSSAQRHVYRGLTLLWLMASLAFWGWWFMPWHIIWVPSFLVTTLVVGYLFGLPGYLLFFVGRMHRPHPGLVPPPGLRVAFATTFVPGTESLQVLEKTIRAMRGQQGYACDVWVLDEGNHPQVRGLCRQVGVSHFSRKSKKRYQQPTWPFKAKTKAGNYNAWLDWLRSQGTDYDVLIQMDTDHAPEPGYLVQMLRPFADPAVGYVAAPSINGVNRDDSWVVSARIVVEGPLHGALQMGYNGGFAPMIFGSHAAYRVRALREIGGFQHTRAEDHHNTVRLNAAGWRGVFNPDAIAIGKGPESFADAMLQEYQWARAITQVLLEFFLVDQRGLPVRLKLEFLFCQTWYAMFAGSQLLSSLVPIVALLSAHPLVRVGYVQFFVLDLLNGLSVLLVVSWLKREGWLRPIDVRVVTWRSALLILARWPFVLIAVFEAAAGRALGRDYPFRVTPKGGRDRKLLPVRIIMPYAILISGSLVAIVWYLWRRENTANGYLYLAMVSAGTYLGLVAAVVTLNQGENIRIWRVPSWPAWRMHVPVHASTLVMAGLLVAIGTTALPNSVDAILGRPPARIWSAAPPGRPSRPATTATALELAAMGDRKMTARPMNVTLPDERPFLGVYDPAGDDTEPLDAEQVFIQLMPHSADQVKNQVRRILRLRRIPIVALEPWPWQIDGLTTQTLLTDLAVGRYDAIIKRVARVVGAFAPATIYVRFAHEMDLEVFPWGQGNPTAFIEAWRHVVQVFRATAGHNVRFIWSPTGRGTSAEYYPGGDVVDAIGATVLTTEEWGPLRGQSFVDLIRGPNALAVQFGKPLIAAETGISAKDPATRMQWIQQTRAAIAQYPLLLGVVYFDAPLPVQFSPPGLQVADWTLTPAERAAFFALPLKG